MTTTVSNGSVPQGNNDSGLEQRIEEHGKKVLLAIDDLHNSIQHRLQKTNASTKKRDAGEQEYLQLLTIFRADTLTRVDEQKHMLSQRLQTALTKRADAESLIQEKLRLLKDSVVIPSDDPTIKLYKRTSMAGIKEEQKTIRFEYEMARARIDSQRQVLDAPAQGRETKLNVCVARLVLTAGAVLQTD